MSDSHVIDKHYRRLGDSYNTFLYYSPEFVRTLTSKMKEKLRLAEDDLLVDLGCGTGMYSIDLVDQVPLSQHVIGVDPFEDMLRQIPEGAPVEPVCEDALAWSAKPGSYDKLFIKETVHHIPERRELFANLYERLTDGGVLLLVHVPPQIRYPLFPAALERCLTWHANPDEMEVELADTGFSVEREGLDYRHQLPKEHYFEMVRNCYMSVLTSFSEDELAAGLREMEEANVDKDVLEFVDHFDYLTATKM